MYKRQTCICVHRSRFLPVKTTNELLLLRSDVYDLDDSDHLVKTTDMTCAVDLDKDFYKKIGDFDDRIPEPPSLRRATSLKVKGDWTFGSEVVVAGDVSLDTEKPQTIPDGTVLTGEVLGAKK